MHCWNSFFNTSKAPGGVYGVLAFGFATAFLLNKAISWYRTPDNPAKKIDHAGSDAMYRKSDSSFKREWGIANSSSHNSERIASVAAQTLLPRISLEETKGIEDSTSSGESISPSPALQMTRQQLILGGNLQREASQIELQIKSEFQAVLQFLPKGILDDLDESLTNYQRKLSKPNSLENFSIAKIRKALKGKISIILMPSDLKLSKNAKPFFSPLKHGEFLNHLHALYCSSQNQKAFDELIAFCNIQEGDHRRNILKFALESLAIARSRLQDIQKRKLSLLIDLRDKQWIEQAARSKEGKFLINEKTLAGKQIIKSCGGRLLAREFNIHSILVSKNGSIVIRYDSDRPFSSGKYKRIFKVADLRNVPANYAWTVMKKSDLLKRFNSPVMNEFRRFLEKNPRLAFMPVHQFLEYRDDKRKIQFGVSLDTLYDGDALDLRNIKKEPVLRASAILKLAKALSALHAFNFVHRDLKNENILLKGIKAFWSDYDFIDRGDKPVNPFSGTIGFIPLDFTLKIFSKTLVQDPDLPKADVFAFAVTLYYDIDVSFQSPGYDPRFRETYFKEIESFTLPRKVIDCKSDELNRVLNQWLLRKQLEHDAHAPNDNNAPYLVYRKFLWQALSPDLDRRPSSKDFEEGLKRLYAMGELPA